MPNHVHTVFAPLSEETPSVPLSAIMHSLKRNTAKQANRLLKRSGCFWEHESFDHYIRNQAEFKRIIKYLLENPVKAGLVDHWKDWRWNYLRDGLLMDDASERLALQRKLTICATTQINNLRYLSALLEQFLSSIALAYRGLAPDTLHNLARYPDRAWQKGYRVRAVSPH
jgi:hypothetical protein